MSIVILSSDKNMVVVMVGDRPSRMCLVGIVNLRRGDNRQRVLRYYSHDDQISQFLQRLPIPRSDYPLLSLALLHLSLELPGHTENDAVSRG